MEGLEKSPACGTLHRDTSQESQSTKSEDVPDHLEVTAVTGYSTQCWCT